MNPDCLLVYAASKGREFLDIHGHYQSADMDADQKRVMKALNLRLRQLVTGPPFEKFALIGPPRLAQRSSPPSMSPTRLSGTVIRVVAVCPRTPNSSPGGGAGCAMESLSRVPASPKSLFWEVASE